LKDPDKYRLQYKLSGKHIVWFGESNQWVGLEPPAFSIYTLFEQGKSPEEIANNITNSYPVSLSEARQLTSDILQSFQKFTRFTNPYFTSPGQPENNPSHSGRSTPPDTTKAFSSHHYIINRKPLRIHYGTGQAAAYLHPPLAHHESNPCNIATAPFEISILHDGNKFFLYDHDREVMRETDLTKIKREFDMLILKAVYGAAESEWFARMHASAVSDGHSAVILSSDSGSGKSTLAAILQSRGYQVISDDLVALHRRSEKAYPVPSAISVKEGASEIVAKYLPGFNPEQTRLHDFGIKKVRFLPPETSDKSTFTPVGTSVLVMVKYDPKTSCRLNTLTPFDGFRRMHDNTWTSGSPEDAKALFRWFSKITCHELVYGDADKGMDTIESLFGKSKS